MSDDVLSEVKWNEMQVTKAQVKWSEIREMVWNIMIETNCTSMTLEWYLPLLFNQRTRTWISGHWTCDFGKYFPILTIPLVTLPALVLVLVLVLILGTSHHQADACHMASVYLGFRSIWNTHFCLRLQPHLYPSLVATSLGRDIRPDSDISQRMSSPMPPSETRNYCWN